MRDRPVVMPLRFLPVFLIAATGCGTSGGPPQTPQLRLPASLEAGRNVYEEDLKNGLGTVSDFFHASGYALQDENLIDSAIVFETSSGAREFIAAEFGVPVESIPGTFSGTVVERKLFLVSREAYREIWRNLYPAWPWTDSSYAQLIVHELAHRAHESVTLSAFGSSDAMGPVWFFEGVAIVCAGQFDDGQPPMTRGELERETGSGRAPAVSYPLYGRIVRSLAAGFSMNVLISRAREEGFPVSLWSNAAGRAPDER